jgi:hypothetical protein
MDGYEMECHLEETCAHYLKDLKGAASGRSPMDKADCRPGFMFSADRHPGVNVALRVLMAVFGSYGLTLVCAAALAAGTPFAFKPDAVSFAVMLAFLVYLLAVIWVFAAATLLRAALGLLLPAAVFGLWLFTAASSGGAS